MGQQPNIELEISDLPRPTPQPAPARRWRPQRPGELDSPDQVPWGGAFGTIGPDAGYVLRLIRGREIPLTEGEHRHNVEIALSAIATARASLFGRAPMGEDVEVALLLLGYDREELPEDLLASLAADRIAWLANIGHDAASRRELVGSIAPATLEAKPAAIRAQMASGRRLIHR